MNPSLQMAHAPMPLLFALLLMFLIANAIILFSLFGSNNKDCSSTDRLVSVKKALVLYAYFEKNAFYAETLDFFFKVGVGKNDAVDYVIIIQGAKCSVAIPPWKNVRVIERPNHCLDFGAYGAAISLLGGLRALQETYSAAIFLNPSVVGPILPKYWPRALHWSHIFLSRLTRDVGVVGTSLVCLPETDPGGHGPRIEGMAWAATFRALASAWQAGVFACFKDKRDAIVNGEYGLSRAVLAAGMNMDSLLLRYQRQDWRDSIHWACNANVHPTRNGTYGEGMSVHPLETVFHKPVWMWGGSVLSTVYQHEVSEYMKWALKRVAEDI